MSNARVEQVFEKTGGILRLKPTFVPRRFSKPGRRLRLHPDDYYALGMARGAIKERWLSSTFAAINGPLAPADEGLSYVALSDDPSDVILLRDFVALLKERLVGGPLWETYGGWPMYSKFFDYEDPLFHHMHPGFEAAAKIGKVGKPEAYYFPPQLNNTCGSFPHTYFGFDPDVTREQVRAALADYENRDTRITELSRAYRIALGTGWYTPPGVVHAPGSYLTYEPQWNSDLNFVFENVTAGEINPPEFLFENCPSDRQGDIDVAMEAMDWEKNVDPHYKKNYYRPPMERAGKRGHEEKWVCYGNPYIGAKEVTIQPGQTAIVADGACYGCIVLQGNGLLGGQKAAAAVMLRYGQLSSDEFFVGHDAAGKGVVIENHSACEPFVMLQHFGPNHPEMP